MTAEHQTANDATTDTHQTANDATTDTHRGMAHGGPTDAGPSAARWTRQEVAARRTERVAELCGVINSAHGSLVAEIAEVIESSEWADGGFRSVEHWVSLYCGASSATARRLVSVARGLVDRPATAQALGAGKLSVDQVVPICRLTPSPYEADLARFAEHATVSQIQRVASEYCFGTDTPDTDTPDTDTPETDTAETEPAGDRDEVSFGATDPGRWRLWADLAPGDGAELEQALKAAHDQLTAAGDAPVTWAAALLELGRGYMGGETVAMAERYQVVVHLRAGGLGSARLHLGQRLSEATVDRLLCDATIRGLIDDGGRPVGLGRRTRTVPAWLRTTIEHRDGGCRVPGCGQRRWLEIHHLVPFSRGGETVPENLAALCGRHHAAHHRGDMLIAGDPTLPDGLLFTNRHGVAVGHVPPTPPGDPPIDAARRLGVHATYTPPRGERLSGRDVCFVPT